MKEQSYSIFIAFVLMGCCLMLPLLGCSKDRAVSSAGPGSSESAPAGLESDPGTPSPLDILPLDDASLSIPVPDFLDAQQQLLYRQAYRVYMAIFFGDTSAIEFLEDGVSPDESETVADETGLEYTVSQGLYSSFSDFSILVHSIFSDDFWNTRPILDSHPMFISSDGRMCYLHLSWPAGYNYYNNNFPDEFELISKTDDEITFNLIGHYSTEPGEDETMEELNLRRSEGYDYTIEFPIRLIRTDEGWRFDQFYSSWADQAAPDTL